MSCALYSMCVVWRWHITVEINECQDGDHNILHGCLSDLPRAFSINNLVDVSWNFHPIFLTESGRQLLYWAINHGAAVDICARQCATLERSHRSSLTIFSSQTYSVKHTCKLMKCPLEYFGSMMVTYLLRWMNNDIFPQWETKLARHRLLIFFIFPFQEHI